MWGDYGTQEFAQRSQQFSAVTRQLHALKGNYNAGPVQLTGFYGNNVQAFQRDIIAPDGTSGYYFLSRRLLVVGSENVSFELTEYNRPGFVVGYVPLTRGVDYDVDYDRGTLLFHSPVFRTELDRSGNLLVRRIVATYQHEGQGGDASVLGGRVQLALTRATGRESWFGATYVREDRGLRSLDLYGADALVNLGSGLELIAEYAHSNNGLSERGSVGGSAYRLDLQRNGNSGFRGRAYYQSVDPGFSNNATESFVPGQKRYGLQAYLPVLSRTALRVQYDHEENEGISPRVLRNVQDLLNPGTAPLPGQPLHNSYTSASVGVEHRLNNGTVSVDLADRTRVDRANPQFSTDHSLQLQTRVVSPLAQRLTFTFLNQLSLTDEKDRILPDRTSLGVDYQLSPGIRAGYTQTQFTSGPFAGQSVSSFGVTGTHRISSATELTGRYSVLDGGTGSNFQGAAGLNHRMQLMRGLRAQFAFEHVFGKALNYTAAGPQFAQPYAVGQGGAALGLTDGDSIALGLDYSSGENFKASARFEHRDSSYGSNMVISADALGKLSPNLTALLRFRQASSSNQLLGALGDTSVLRLGLAYRPLRTDKLNLLLRYDRRHNPASLPGSILGASGTNVDDATFGLEAIFAPHPRWEFYGKFAVRHSETSLSQGVSSNSRISFSQFRALYRLGSRWDMAAEARWIDQPQAGFSHNAFFLEAGYMATPKLRVAAGYGFGRTSELDFEGRRMVGGPYLNVTLKLDELFSGFGLQKPVKAAPKKPKTQEAAPTDAPPADAVPSGAPEQPEPGKQSPAGEQPGHAPEAPQPAPDESGTAEQ